MRQALDRYTPLFIPKGRRTKSYAGKEGIIDDLHYAMLNRLTCTVTYYSFSDDTLKSYRVNPLHFFERAGGL